MSSSGSTSSSTRSSRGEAVGQRQAGRAGGGQQARPAPRGSAAARAASSTVRRPPRPRASTRGEISPRCSSSRGEVGVRRVVGVEAPDRGVGEQDAAAAVGLQAVLVRVDHDRVGASHRRRRARRDARIAAVGEQREEPAVGGVDVQARSVLRAQAGDRPTSSRAPSEVVPSVATTVPTPRPEARRQRAEVHAPARAGGDRLVRDSEHAAHAGVRVVGGGRGDDRAARGAARAPPTAPRGWRSCPRRSGAPGAARRRPACPPAARPPRAPCAAVAGPPSSAWLLGLSSIAVA